MGSGRLAASVAAALFIVVSGFSRTNATSVAPPGSGFSRTNVFAQSPSEYSRDWKRLRSENFTAAGNADYAAMRSVLAELEGFRRALLRTVPALRAATPRDTTVVIFKDDRSFAPFKPRDATGRRRDAVMGYLLNGPAATYLAVAMHGDRARTFQYLFHEYTHHVVHQNMGAVPEWLNEGLAEFYSTFRASPRDGRSVLGEAPASRLVTLRGTRLLPLREVLAAGRGATLDGDVDRASALYAQSWALVHYLTMGDGGRHRREIATYLSALQVGSSVDAAVASAFGMPLEALEREVLRHVRQQPIPSLTIEEPREGVRLRTSLEAMLERDVATLHEDMRTLLARAQGPHR